MGCKEWTWGTQAGLRIYTNSIRRLGSILDVPSKDMQWNSLNHFLSALQGGGDILPYSRNIFIINDAENPISATLTIAKHGRTSQGYITAPLNTWLKEFVDMNLDQNFNFEYLVAPDRDTLVVPDPTINPINERRIDNNEIQQRVRSFCLNRHRSPPPKAREIGLYFELEEVKLQENMGFCPSHRYPSVTSLISSLRRHNISCDIDLLDGKGNFIKYIEVKAVAGAPGAAFNLTIKEWVSREKCQTNNWPYEIVVYYHVGRKVLERRVIVESEHLVSEPTGYWCYLPETGGRI